MDRYLFVGTGKLLDQPDLTDYSVTNSIYVIKDGNRTTPEPAPATPYSRTNLNAVSGTSAAGFSGTATGRGWYQDATSTNQKINSDVHADLDVVAFGFSEPSSDPCLSALTSTLFVRDLVDREFGAPLGRQYRRQCGHQCRHRRGGADTVGSGCQFRHTQCRRSGDIDGRRGKKLQCEHHAGRVRQAPFLLGARHALALTVRRSDPLHANAGPERWAPRYAWPIETGRGRAPGRSSAPAAFSAVVNIGFVKGTKDVAVGRSGHWTGANLWTESAIREQPRASAQGLVRPFWDWPPGTAGGMDDEFLYSRRNGGRYS